MRVNSEYMSHRGMSRCVLLEQVLKDRHEAFRAEWFERLRFEERASDFPIKVNSLAVYRFQKAAQLRIVGKLSHIDKAVRGDQFVDVGSPPIDRNRAGAQTIEQLLREPSLDRRVLEAKCKIISREGLPLGFQLALVDFARRG